MKCPHCEEEIAGTPCPGCGEAVIDEDANYCMACGIALKESAPPVSRSDDIFDDEEEDIDFDSRELCPDGTCTGIIVDGKCSECGRKPGEMVAPEKDVAKEDAVKSKDETENGESARDKDA